MHAVKSVSSCMFNIPTSGQLSSGKSFSFGGYKIATDFVFLNYFTVWCSGDAPVLAALCWFAQCQAYLFLLCSEKERVSWCCSSHCLLPGTSNVSEQPLVQAWPSSAAVSLVKCHTAEKGMAAKYWLFSDGKKPTWLTVCRILRFFFISLFT